tara:strand:+ start:29573 stop:30070 length:498 start_codon:yes stop_codon:yes gene_type:complete
MMRYYDPSVGRYITSDRIGILGGLNTYAYVGNNPTVYFDPDGQARRRKDGDPDVRNMCSYYNKVCSATGGKCNYPCKTAPFLCNNPDVLPLLWVGVSSGQISCIRKCLIEEDKKERNKSPECTGDDCLANESIDDYHRTCYQKCGVATWRYPGLTPFGIDIGAGN